MRTLISSVAIFLLVACGRSAEPVRVSVPRTPAPEPTPIYDISIGKHIFEEIDRLGTSEFNSLYNGREVKITRNWDTGIIGSSIHAVSIVQRPTSSPIFNSSGRANSHDGQIIVAAGAYEQYASRRTYICIVDNYRSGTLYLGSCSKFVPIPTPT